MEFPSDSSLLRAGSSDEDEDDIFSDEALGQASDSDSGDNLEQVALHGCRHNQLQFYFRVLPYSRHMWCLPGRLKTS